MKDKISPLQKALNFWAIILIIWSLYRANLRMPEWFDEFIAKPLVFVLPVFFYIQKIENKKIMEGLWLNPKKIFSDLIIALGIALIFFTTAIFANFIKSHQITFLSQSTSLNGLFIIIITALATGFSEEVLSRGFVLKRLYEESKNFLTASFFASILFFFLHVPILFTNIKITGNLLLFFMLSDLILSLFCSFVFLIRKSLFLPIFIHALYNITLLLFI